MFGYVTTNAELLEKQEIDRYQAFYCGLCLRLGQAHGGAGRATLSYDMTFLSLLLSSAYALEESEGSLRCPLHPLRQRTWLHTAATDYAADMNLLLAYYKTADDWNDDRSLAALGKQKLLAKGAAQAGERWPRQREAVETGLRLLAAMEKADERNPDLPINCFGDIMGVLFAYAPAHPVTPILSDMGAALGRFLYLMDACMDLREDIKKQRYNPLVGQAGIDYEPILTVLIGECTQAFEALSPERDARLLRNILYSGVWLKYKSKFKKEGNATENDRSL